MFPRIVLLAALAAVVSLPVRAAPSVTTPLADLVLVQAATPNPAGTGKDIVFDLTLTNNGPADATQARIFMTFAATVSQVWITPGCPRFFSPTQISYCDWPVLAAGSSVSVRLVLRNPNAGTTTVTANAQSDVADPDATNNTANVLAVPTLASPAAAAVARYRLYSPATFEHLFTTDRNEYDTLGSYAGTWVQEGTVGHVLDNPGAYNGVNAKPCYRLFNTSTGQHHWTTDANEYYTLVLFPQYRGEGADGYLLPTQAPGTIALYRLLYPYSVPVAGLHHWTIDASEYDALIATYGWVGEGGSGFVIP